MKDSDGKKGPGPVAQARGRQPAIPFNPSCNRLASFFADSVLSNAGFFSWRKIRRPLSLPARSVDAARGPACTCLAAQPLKLFERSPGHVMIANLEGRDAWLSPGFRAHFGLAEDRSFFADDLANAVFQSVESRLELCHLTTCGLDHRNLDDGHGSEHASSEGPPGGDFEAHDLHLSTVHPLNVRIVV